MSRMAKTIRSFIAAVAFTAGAVAASGVQAAAGDYCIHADGTVYCGVEENIVEGDPGLRDCIRRWELAVRNCPPEV
ncbi:hypothetical protein ER13_03845 [Brevundimonas sp. EAKA]|jgi:hypothetical protein|uniref:hypothetical protein n=1 Tax=Brevundimonas sp. EAKA TaxID=1495854 RepID=UPI0004A957B0|nr:hypothetical protein [Brevundimonas sp. EAKA]KDP93109.1 hypothetical protein ER13_03845 [Brevundimonas sp. EAKA]